MAAPVLTKEPTSITAGDSVEFEVSPSDYPPSEGWSVAYTLILPGSRADFTVTDDGTTYTATLAASALETIVTEVEARLIGLASGSGDYAGERHTFYDAFVTVLPNPTATTLDGMRSAAQIELDAVRVAILALTEGRLASYSIAGRAYQYNELAVLHQRQAVLESRVASEQGRGFRRRYVAFPSVRQ